jgi:hypothetical protein
MTTRIVTASGPKGKAPAHALATLADYARGKAPPPPRVRRSPNRHERRAILARGRDRATTEDDRRRLGGKVRLRPVKSWQIARVDVNPACSLAAVADGFASCSEPLAAFIAPAPEIDLAALRGAR